MKAIQPDGAIRLVGYSFGACVAIEMALQLQQQAGPMNGQTVESLVLLDGSHSFAPYLDNSKERMTFSGLTAGADVTTIKSLLMIASRFTSLSREVCCQ